MTKNMFAQKGWICPKCGRVLAPSTMYCLWCCSDMKESTTTTGTSIPKWNTTPIKVGSGMIDSNGTGRSYFVETSSISRDSHEIAKTEPSNSEKPNNCEDDLHDVGRQIQSAYDKGAASDTSAIQALYTAGKPCKDEPQTERSE